MSKIKFNYRNRQGQPITFNVSTEELSKFESDYKIKVEKKYEGTLVVPTVEVVLSDDGNDILDTHLFSEGVLKH